MTLTETNENKSLWKFRSWVRKKQVGVNVNQNCTPAQLQYGKVGLIYLTAHPHTRAKQPLEENAKEPSKLMMNEKSDDCP